MHCSKSAPLITALKNSSGQLERECIKKSKINFLFNSVQIWLDGPGKTKSTRNSTTIRERDFGKKRGDGVGKRKTVQV